MPTKKISKTKTIAKNESAATLPKDYAKFLKSIKQEISTARIKAALSVNRELTLLYWSIGSQILTMQEREGWGTKVVERLSKDLSLHFPEIKGFSLRNLKYMRSFAEAYSDHAIVQQAAAQIPWFHNCLLLDKVKNQTAREWYIHKTIENGWSRNVLAIHIERELYEAKGRATTNFELTMPKLQSDLTRELFKNPYNFEFLDIHEEAKERDIEQGLVAKIIDFLLELGSGFSFMGNQYRLKVGGEEFIIDMLFYHVKLKRYLVIELKTGAFKPEYVGKLNFYLAAIDDLLRDEHDEPTIGLILCKDKNHIVADYALSGTKKPMGVSTFKLPKKLKEALPSVEELEAKLSEDKPE